MTATKQAVETKPQPAGGEARLRGHWLALARLGFAVVAIGALVIWAWGIPIRYAQLATVCTAQPCGDQQPTPDTIAQFQAAGISINLYAAYTGTLEVIFALVFLVVAAMIVWRKSDTSIGLLTALLLITTAAEQTSSAALAAAIPALSIPINLLGILSFVTLIMFLLLFPDGRFVPRWTRFVTCVWIPLFIIGGIVAPPDLFVLMIFLSIVVSLPAQLYRYRRVSSLAERLQTKWVVFSLVIGLLGSIGIISASNFLKLTQMFGSLGFFAGNTLIYVFSALIPLSIGIAILRSRLWDIDILIKKALVYGTLTVLLAGLYAGLVIGLERLAGAINTGSLVRQPPAIVISTLVIAALFQPLRSRIQSLIDRRFYRRRYDAAHALATFSATLRDEVDLTQLQSRLLAVIQETMQPAQISLWLAQPASQRPQAVD
ncbi:MAG TPA: hypothetical protein VGF38_18305 [Ktedonobacterales bacterium]